MNSKNTIAVYHWWDHPDDAKPYCNLRSPIIPAIATLRGVSDVQICVLDLSGKSKEYWGGFPEKLNFSVIPYKGSMEKYRDKVAGWLHLSRFFDVFKYAADCAKDKNIMYVDSDVFWLKNPFPFEIDQQKMNINKWNTGFFYFNPKNINKQFFEIFQNYTISAIHSHDIRGVLKKYVNYNSWYDVWDEMIITYMAQNHADLFRFIGPKEHATIRTFPDDIQSANMFHANGLMVGNPAPKTPGERNHCRGLLGLIVKNFYVNMIKALSAQDLSLVYNYQEVGYCFSKQFEISNDVINKIRSTNRDGNYYLQELNEQTNIII